MFNGGSISDTNSQGSHAGTFCIIELKFVNGNVLFSENILLDTRSGHWASWIPRFLSVVSFKYLNIIQIQTTSSFQIRCNSSFTSHHTIDVTVRKIFTKVAARTRNKEVLRLVCFCCPKLRRRSLPGMLLDTHERDLMANDELLLTVLKAFVPRLQNTDVTRTLAKFRTFSVSRTACRWRRYQPQNPSHSQQSPAPTNHEVLLLGC